MGIDQLKEPEPWGRTRAEGKEDCFGCSLQTAPVPGTTRNQGGWSFIPPPLLSPLGCAKGKGQVACESFWK